MVNAELGIYIHYNLLTVLLIDYYVVGKSLNGTCEFLVGCSTA